MFFHKILWFQTKTQLIHNISDIDIIKTFKQYALRLYIILKHTLTIHTKLNLRMLHGQQQYCPYTIFKALWRVSHWVLRLHHSVFMFLHKTLLNIINRQQYIKNDTCDDKHNLNNKIHYDLSCLMTVWTPTNKCCLMQLVMMLIVIISSRQLVKASTHKCVLTQLLMLHKFQYIKSC